MSILYADSDFFCIQHQRRGLRTDYGERANRSSASLWGKIVTARGHFPTDTAWFAGQYPYTLTRLAKLSERVKKGPFGKLGIAGRSTEGFLIIELTITVPGVSFKGKNQPGGESLKDCERLDCWKLEGRPLDVFIDFHEFSSKRGRAKILILPRIPIRNTSGKSIVLA
ncbi:MAG: hypothetical protein NC911_05040 [Candidatus Omnitrophica bacterium]|nr:hypothetical protein [Candidatus Omnitrophota bacterium]